MRGALRRPVVVSFFGAEEWGLHGSRAFAASPPDGIPPIVAALNLDTVGQRGVPSVNVVGESIYPALAAVMGRCLAGAGLRRGRDIDRFAFAWGSDHYALHAAGIPAIDLFSAEYRTMHTPEDTTDTVDPDKLVRLARAAAALALSLSREGLPR
jgi:Zn-dependent M28 family amino/carboxypeptidase